MDAYSTKVSIDLSIVIVSWNVSDLLRQCLLSILYSAVLDSHQSCTWRLDASQYTFEVIVVDSHSSDDSVEMVKQEFPAVRLHASETNLGYAGGNNFGLAMSRGQYILLLNPDTVIVDDALSTMLDYIETHPDVGVVGPQLRYGDGCIQSSRRRFPNRVTALIESTFLQKWFPHHPAVERYYMQDIADDIIQQVDWLNGACLMVRKSVYAQVGPLDEAFFMYSEELDWQRRIREAGWNIVYLPPAQITHFEGKSSAQVRALTHIRFNRSKVRYFRKHDSLLFAEGLRRWIMFHFVYEWTVEGLKWLIGHKRDLRAQRMYTYCRVLKSRLRELPTEIVPGAGSIEMDQKESREE